MKRNGFTLVELLVTIAIVGIIVPPILNFFLSQYQTYYREENKMEAQQTSRSALDYIVSHMRRSNQSLIDVQNNIVTVVEKSTTGILSSDPDKRYRYYLEQSVLYREVSKNFNPTPTPVYWNISASKDQLTQNVISFTVIRVNNMVTLTIEIEVPFSTPNVTPAIESHRVKYQNIYTIGN